MDEAANSASWAMMKVTERVGGLHPTITEAGAGDHCTRGLSHQAAAELANDQSHTT